MRYNCLGDNIYEIILTVKRDCNLGADDAQFDDPAHVGIYNINGQLLDYLAFNGQLLLQFEGDKNLQNEIQQVCFSSSNEICVHSTEYRATVELSPNSNGYILAYQRCCRNSSLNNVVSPLQTGMTLSVELSRQALQECNSSPSFDQSPDIFICEGEVLEFDGSATDADGDELRYSLCTPYSGASEDWPQPKPGAAPPYDQIEWIDGFAAGNPLGLNAASMDAETGMFTIMPESLGQFLVGMCVEEYRDGELLSITTREFQYNVVRCSNEIVSNFTVAQNGCSLDGVQFTNETPDASDYTWFFNYPSTDPAFISNDPNPVFNYPEAGTYTVRLVTNSDGTVCESISDKHITISDAESTEIISSILFCDRNTYTFRLTDPVADRTQRQWIININGEQQSATSQFVDVIVNRDEQVEVELTATSETGCVETQTLNFNSNLIDFTTDIVICTATPNQLTVILNPNPITGLINNPIVSYEWNATNGSTVVQSFDESLTLDVDFSEVLWVGLTVEFENGCTAEVERNIKPFGTISHSAQIETIVGNTVTFFNNDQIITNVFDNPNSELQNEEIVKKEWIILSPSQGEISGEGNSISYTTDLDETIEVIYRFTTASGCTFEIKQTYSFADLCASIGTDEDICAILNADPNNELADLDCDNDGIDNATECDNGTDPNNPDDACDAVLNGSINICELLASDPNNPLAVLDCDNDGVDNITECNNGTDPTDPVDACVAIDLGDLDICALLSQNPDSGLAMFDCDGDGINNITECQNGGNPNDPTDACISIINGDLDVCGLLTTFPDSPVGGLDCDGDGFNNADECIAGSDPNDGCDIPEGQSIDICAILEADPNSPLANLDCDNGGIDNATECQNGGNPNDPNDECTVIQNAGIDICALLSEDPNSPIANLDCDNDGVDNGTECSSGTNPLDPSDGCIGLQNAGINICTFLSENPNSPVATLDCDGDGVDNITECNNGTDPNDRDDACLALELAGIDICTFLGQNPGHPVGEFDCDNDGVNNITECNNGTDPNNSNNACDMLEAGSDICQLLATNPSNELANADCDGDGFSNLDECASGSDPSDGCDIPDGESIDICAILATNPNSPLASNDCDGDGFTNLDECNRGSDPADGCSIPEGETIDICAILAADPNSPIGLFDCDNGGINNAIECSNGGNPNDPDDDCMSAFDPAVDICNILTENPDSPLGMLDCDGDGFSNIDECNAGSDPVDGCDFPGDGILDICEIIAADPTSPLGMFDCDGDGFSNLDECNRGSDPNDGCDNPEGETIDICAIIAADPDSPLGMFDCDGGGIDNATECDNGGDPNDPNDECLSAYDDSVDICAILAENPDSPLGALDCDGDGFTNAEECDRGSDPADGCDLPDGETIDICAILAADPDSPLGMFDCDGGGIDNATECENGGDPNDPTDECLSAFDDSVDICAILSENPNSPLGDLDCDGDGFTNAEECSSGSDPADGCDLPEGETIDICAILEADPDSPIGMFDCDNAGVDNATECENGTDPNDPNDECEAITDDSFDICTFLEENPDSPLGALDCDGDGVDNATECQNGTDPTDPNDNCPTGVSIDIGEGLGIPAVICAGVDTPIFVTVDSQDSLFFEWAPTDCIVSGAITTAPVINVTADKQLQLRVLNESIGCESIIDVPLDISDPSVLIEFDPISPVNVGDDVEISAIPVATDPTFNWSNGETSESFENTISQTETYTVTITDAFGCEATASTTLDVNAALCDASGIFLPNSFSPNGDNLNDILFVRSNAIETLEFSVFDRWGREVFKSNSIDVGWNGRWQNDGDELAPDAYAYWIKATCFSGEEFVQQGNVSIIR